MPGSKRKTPRLRFGRISVPGENYFVTICTKRRAQILVHPATARAVITAMLELQAAGDAEILAATVMPDHVHLLLTLGQRLSIGQTIGKFKALAREQGRAVWKWQDDGFEHRVRDIESIEDYAFYIFMNPYRANLIGPNIRWHFWLCPNPYLFHFTGKLPPDGALPVEWFRIVDTVAQRIRVGS